MVFLVVGDEQNLYGEVKSLEASSRFLLIISIIMIIVSPILLIITAMIAFAVGHIASGMERLSSFTIFYLPFIIFLALFLAGVLRIFSWKKLKRVMYCLFAGVALLICNMTYFSLLIITQGWTSGSAMFFFILIVKHHRIHNYAYFLLFQFPDLYHLHDKE